MFSSLEILCNETADVPWYLEECTHLELGDKKRHDRLLQILAGLWDNPTGSLPQAFPEWKQLKAVYRFYDNEHICPEELLAGHIFASINRCKTVPTVLAISDTTLVNYTAHEAKVDLGHLNGNQRGLLVHSVFSVTPEGIPLGLLGQHIWTRDLETKGIKQQRKQRSFEEKESFKWVIGFDQLQEAACCCPSTEFDYICDAEGDIYELFEREREKNVELLVRASQNRRVESEESYLWETLQAQECQAHLKVRLPQRGDRAAREAQLELRYSPITLRIPHGKPGAGKTGLRLWGVLLTEESPPEGEEAVEWLLLTSRELRNVEDAVETTQKYGRRWDIEIFHRVLKSGCTIEKLQLERLARLQRALPLYSIVGWRIMFATQLGRELPDVSCTALLERSEWEALYCAIHKSNEPCDSPPTVGEVVQWIAQLGGYLGRKHDGPPGPTVMWRGFQILAKYTEMYCFMKGKDP